MFPSSGYFRAVGCPYYSGLCDRPYCHFGHVKAQSVQWCLIFLAYFWMCPTLGTRIGVPALGTQTTLLKLFSDTDG